MINVKYLSTAAMDDSLSRGQRHWRAIVSLKSDLCRENPWCVMGREESQEEAPFSWAR